MDGQLPRTGNEDPFAAASHSTADYMKHSGSYKPPIGQRITPASHRPHSFGALKWGALAVIVLAIIVLGGYELLRHHSKATPAGRSTAVNQQRNGQPPPAANTITSSTLNYVSNGQDLNLSFSYPGNWSVSPPSGHNQNDQTIYVTSPLTTITTANGNSVTGKVVISVRPGTATISELEANNPVAAATSNQIAYSSPTPSQYQYPYLTFIHFSNGQKVSGAFEEALVTGELQFTSGEAISNSDLAGLDPVIAASFYQCASTSCSGSAASPLSINAGTWQNSSIFNQTLNIIESFKLN